MMLSPWFTFALVSQVLMGTAYVLGLQIVNETIVQMSLGSDTRYRFLNFIARIIFDACVGLSGCAFILYEAVGPKFPFIAMTVLSSMVMLVYMMGMRLGFIRKLFREGGLLHSAASCDGESDDEASSDAIIIIPSPAPELELDVEQECII